jgi:hypothetical protein
MGNPTNQISPRPTGKKESSDVLQAQVLHTRAEIQDTVHTIQQRLSPDRLRQQIKAVARGSIESMTHQARITADEWRFNITESIANNPLPVVMTGLGLVWLMKQAVGATQNDRTTDEKSYSLTPEEEWPEFRPEVASGRSTRQGAAEDMGTRTQVYGQETGERLSQWTTHAQEYAGELKSRAQEQTARMRTRAQAKAEGARSELQNLLHDNPLAVGATLFVVGAAIGLSLPRTQRENEWLGDSRDRLIKQAKSTARTAGNTVKSMAGNMVEEIMDEVKSAAEEIQKETKNL